MLYILSTSHIYLVSRTFTICSTSCRGVLALILRHFLILNAVQLPTVLQSSLSSPLEKWQARNLIEPASSRWLHQMPTMESKKCIKTCQTKNVETSSFRSASTIVWAGTTQNKNKISKIKSVTEPHINSKTNDIVNSPRN